jgi:hypothetical protein
MSYTATSPGALASATFSSVWAIRPSAMRMVREAHLAASPLASKKKATVNVPFLADFFRASRAGSPLPTANMEMQ